VTTIRFPSDCAVSPPEFSAGVPIKEHEVVGVTYQVNNGRLFATIAPAYRLSAAMAEGRQKIAAYDAETGERWGQEARSDPGRLDALIRDYEAGCEFRRGDKLAPRKRPGLEPRTYGVVGNAVVVLSQSALIPHEYTVIGEASSYTERSDRFVKFEINGHDWEKVGR
jgi:hypothetical protein